jgi:hypothetical protein
VSTRGSWVTGGCQRLCRTRRHTGDSTGAVAELKRLRAENAQLRTKCAGAPRRHRACAEREMVRRHHRDSHRRRQTLFRFGAGPAFAPPAGQSDCGSPDAAQACDAIKMQRRCAAAAPLSTGRSTAIADLLTQQRVSRLRTGRSECRNRWEGSVDVSITPLRRRS